ncbi:MAG: cellulase family glycosylhydrolase [Actinomycetota bacterium]
MEGRRTCRGPVAPPALLTWLALVGSLLMVASLLMLGGAETAAAHAGHAHTKQARLAHAAGPKAPLGHAGRWVTDRKGRVVVLHGVNMVYKRPPYHPAAIGFNGPDADFLKRHGFNTVRLGLIYAGVEPQPGQYDAAYIRTVRRTEKVLAKRRIFSMIDFHQDLYNEKFTGEGFPAWATIDDGFPAEPLTGFSQTYITSPGLNRAFANLWANRTGPGGVGLQDRYAAAWQRVALAFRRRQYNLGYDIINEPWPGNPTFLTCASTEGCPAFEQQMLAPMQQKAINAIRTADGRHLVWYEPVVTTQFGTKYHHPDTGDPKAGMSFHIYCLTGGAGAASDSECETLEELSLNNAQERAKLNGDTLLLSEFGATDREPVIERMVDRADRNMVSWQWWHYCGCNDPTTTGPGDTQALIKDPKAPPTGDNLFLDKIKLLERPYPQAVAGTPERYFFKRESRRFELVFSKKRASGSGRFRRGLSDVFVPKLHYPQGYRAEVSGAKVLSKRNRQHLILRGMPAAQKVTVTITPR